MIAGGRGRNSRLVRVARGLGHRAGERLTRHGSDHVFGPNVSTSTVYDAMVSAVTRSAVRGFNGTVFAYGQTSSGKTFTMEGSEHEFGLIHLAVHDVFRAVSESVRALIRGSAHLARIPRLTTAMAILADAGARLFDRRVVHGNLQRDHQRLA